MSSWGSYQSGNAGIKIPQVIYCPICNIQVPSLEYLNDHLDQDHVEGAREGLFNWLRKTQSLVMSPFTKVASGVISSETLNKITGNIVFEKNSNKQILIEVYGIKNVDEVDSEELITKLHWVREKGNAQDLCQIHKCNRSLGMRNGKHHCRSCGLLCCDIHGSYQIRLNPKTAKHDPMKGLWYRVCEKCYVGREGYFDNQGVSRNRTGPFMKLRKIKIDHAIRESSKLQKRVEKLVFNLQDEFERRTKDKPTSSLSVDAQWIREIEKSIVHWERDDLFTNCPICGASFQKFFVRKHHCRLCGIVLCSSSQCLNYLKVNSRDQSQLIAEIKTCAYCYSIIRRHHDFNVACPSIFLIPIHEDIHRLKSSVHENLNNFNHQLQVIQAKEFIDINDKDYQIGLKYRKILLDIFSNLDGKAKEIKLIGNQNPTLSKLSDNICRSLVQYLQANMFSLRLLPKPTQSIPHSSSSSNNIQQDAHDIPLQHIPRESMQEYFALKEKESVLSQQILILDQSIDEAIKKRKFEDVTLLKTNFNEIQVELEYVRAQLKSL